MYKGHSISVGMYFFARNWVTLLINYLFAVYSVVCIQVTKPIMFVFLLRFAINNRNWLFSFIQSWSVHYNEVKGNRCTALLRKLPDLLWVPSGGVLYHIFIITHWNKADLAKCHCVIQSVVSRQSVLTMVKTAKYAGLRTCAVSFANGLHTIHHELKFVIFCVNVKRIVRGTK